MEQTLEEAHYYWTISAVCDLIEAFGYTKVINDIDNALRANDLELTIDSILPTEDNE